MGFPKYNHEWQSDDALSIEMACIEKGGTWTEGETKCGEGLFHHYRECFKLLWPNEDIHRWVDIILEAYLNNDVSVLVGCSDSGKTHTISKIVLVDYFCFPSETLWLVSTTEGRGSELRVWGVIKDLFNQARERYRWLPGNPIDYLKTITTGVVDKEKFSSRSLRRGIIVVPCKTGGLGSGLSGFIGIKAPRLRHAGDEVQLMSDGFLNSYSNWFGKEDFKGIMAGNFMETDDPLGTASEPVDGWDSFVDTGKTQSWKSRFYDAQVVALDGRDSPNFDFPDHEEITHYKYIIGHKKLNAVAKTHGTNSWQWHSMCIGKPVKGMDIWRVLTKDFCKLHKASEEIIWEGSKRTSIYSIDPAYGLGDLCVGRHVEMGRSVDGKQMLYSHEPEIIPIAVNTGIEPEDQIARFTKQRLAELNIPPQNCFYDSFGRGTLGHAFAIVFGSIVPVPVDSGAQPTKRPVRFDLKIKNHDGKDRLKRCDEHYKKFVSEMWFSVREAIETEQIRGLDGDTILEGCSRKFSKENNYIILETKEEMKKRTSGRSPDRFDNFAIAVEGARRLGFRIERLGADVVIEPSRAVNKLKLASEAYSKIEKSKELAQV